MVLDVGVISVCLHQPQTERADHWWFRKETQRLEKSLWSSVFNSTKLNKWNIVLRRLKKLSLVLCSVQVITGRETTETCLVNHQLVVIDSLSYSLLFIYSNQTWRRFKPAAVTLTEWELLRLTTRCNHQLWFGQSGAGLLFWVFFSVEPVMGWAERPWVLFIICGVLRQRGEAALISSVSCLPPQHTWQPISLYHGGLVRRKKKRFWFDVVLIMDGRFYF